MPPVQDGRSLPANQKGHSREPVQLRGTAQTLRLRSCSPWSLKQPRAAAEAEGLPGALRRRRGQHHPWPSHPWHRPWPSQSQMQQSQSSRCLQHQQTMQLKQKRLQMTQDTPKPTQDAKSGPHQQLQQARLTQQSPQSQPPPSQ